MIRKNVYLILAVIGFFVPYWFLLGFMNANGLNLPALVQQLFANHISTFFAVDLMISVIVFWIFLVSEAVKLHMSNWWLYILATLIVGLSFALPLFLYFRERKLQAE